MNHVCDADRPQLAEVDAAMDAVERFVVLVYKFETECCLS